MANSKNYWGKNYYKNPNLNSAKTSQNNSSSKQGKTTSKSGTSNKTSSTRTSAKKATNSAVNKGLNSVISSTISSAGLSDSHSRAVSGEIKKLPIKSKICVILLFIIGVAISIGVCYFICRNDQFEIIGKKTITLNIGDSYQDAKAKVIAFGKDISSEVKIEVYKDGELIGTNPDNLDTSEECTYQIFYKLNNFRFRDVKIARTITIINPEEVPPEEDAYGDEELLGSKIKFDNEEHSEVLSSINKVTITLLANY